MRARLLARWRGEGSTALEVAPPDCPGAKVVRPIGCTESVKPTGCTRLVHRSRPPPPRALSRTAAVTRRACKRITNRNTRHRRQDDGGQGRDPDRPRGVTPNGTSEFVDHVRTGWTPGSPTSQSTTCATPFSVGRNGMCGAPKPAEWGQERTDSALGQDAPRTRTVRVMPTLCSPSRKAPILLGERTWR